MSRLKMQFTRKDWNFRGIADILSMIQSDLKGESTVCELSVLCKEALCDLADSISRLTEIVRSGSCGGII